MGRRVGALVAGVVFVVFAGCEGCVDDTTTDADGGDGTIGDVADGDGTTTGDDGGTDGGDDGGTTGMDATDTTDDGGEDGGTGGDTAADSGGGGDADGTGSGGDTSMPVDGDATVSDGDAMMSSCSGRKIPCGGSCVDPYTNDNHCGGCGTTCAGNASCEKGTCSCPEYNTYCPNNGGCVSTTIDNDNCGSCGNSCNTSSTNEVCNGGQCVNLTNVGCPAQTTYCSGVSQCVDLDTNDDHCGACGNACGPNQGCASGTCAKKPSLGTPAKCQGADPSINVGFKTNKRKQKCTGSVATTTFRWALCSCDDVTLMQNYLFDAFNSQTGPYKPGGFGGGVGTNGKFTAGKGEIYGALWTSSSRGIFADNNLRVYQQLHSGGVTEFRVEGTVGGDAFIKGDLIARSGGGPLSMEGQKVVVDPNATIQDPTNRIQYPNAGSPTRNTVSVSTVCKRCKQNRRIPVSTIVNNHQGMNNNDNNKIGLNASVLDQPNQAINLELPCGKYYLNEIDTNSKVTIIATGRTALFVDGDLFSGTSITIRAARGAEFDVFVNGSVTMQNEARVGAPAFPANNRFYTNGPWESVNNTALGGYIYAVPGGINLKNNAEVFGGLYTQDLTTMNNPEIHYDREVLRQRKECKEPCTKKGNACTSSGECCNALACTNGTCGGSGGGGGGDVGVDADGGTITDADGSTTNDTTSNDTSGSDADTSCVSKGGSCTSGTQCCSSLSCTNGTCGTTCTQEGGTCSADSDCCSSLLCTDGTCGSSCSQEGESCASDGDCCSPLVCDGGTCSTSSCKNLYESCSSGSECCSGQCGCSGGSCYCVST